MYVVKDSSSVISIGRLVVDDGYGFVRRHKHRKAVLIVPEGSRRQLWTDNFTPMLRQSDGPTIGIPTEPLTAAVHTAPLVAPTTTSPLPSWYCGPKRVVDEKQSGAWLAPTTVKSHFVEIFSG